jgi:hypothetical protein
VGTHCDPANGLARETLLARLGLDCDLIARESDEAPGGHDPDLVLNLKSIVEVDAKREILERVNYPSGAVRPCQ